MNVKNYLKKQKKTIDSALLHYLPRQNKTALEAAIRYAVLSDGKRVRPILTLAAAECVGGSVKEALPAACAVEFIHSYSLVHDDLPCMDDDAMRRGRPSCHKKFGEVTALLAGDALLTLAFQVLATFKSEASTTVVTKRLRAIAVLAEAAGMQGMVGGQALDMEYQGKKPDLKTLTRINAHKTGDLISASLRLGAILGGATKAQEKALFAYGTRLGLLFQIVDDILDKDGYARILGSKRIQAQANALCLETKRQLRPFGDRSQHLEAIADFVLTRKH